MEKKKTRKPKTHPKPKIKREAQAWRREATAETPRPRFWDLMVVKDQRGRHDKTP